MTTTITTTKTMTTTMTTTTTKSKTKHQQQQEATTKKHKDTTTTTRTKKRQQRTTKTTRTLPWLCFSLPFWGGGFGPPTPPFFLVWHLLRHFCLKGTKKFSFFSPSKSVLFVAKPFWKKMVATQFFGKRYKNSFFFLRILKNLIFWKKMVELLPARFQGPPKNGCYFFWGLFFFFFCLCFFCI